MAVTTIATTNRETTPPIAVWVTAATTGHHALRMSPQSRPAHHRSELVVVWSQTVIVATYRRPIVAPFPTKAYMLL